MIGEDFPGVLAAAQAGQDWAVAVLYRELNPLLLRYLRARVGADADDLAGEVWLAIARQLPGFEGDEAGLRGWLFTIAKRQVIGQWRRDRRRRTSPVDTEELADRRAPDDTEQAALSGAVADDAVRALIEGLPPDQAEVVLLRVVAGLDVVQVAAIMGKKPGTVRVLQHRALRRLAAIHGAEVVTP